MSMVTKSNRICNEAEGFVIKINSFRSGALFFYYLVLECHLESCFYFSGGYLHVSK